jgi:hypothetical protein
LGQTAGAIEQKRQAQNVTGELFQGDSGKLPEFLNKTTHSHLTDNHYRTNARPRSDYLNGPKTMPQRLIIHRWDNFTSVPLPNLPSLGKPLREPGLCSGD